jgi:hypothetical protein
MLPNFMGYCPIGYTEDGTYGTIRYSGMQIDICYGEQGRFGERGHVIIQNERIIYIREAVGIPADCQLGQTVQPSGLNAMVSGGSLFLLQKELNTSGTSC